MRPPSHQWVNTHQQEVTESNCTSLIILFHFSTVFMSITQGLAQWTPPSGGLEPTQWEDQGAAAQQALPPCPLCCVKVSWHEWVLQQPRPFLIFLRDHRYRHQVGQRLRNALWQQQAPSMQKALANLKPSCGRIKHDRTMAGGEAIIPEGNRWVAEIGLSGRDNREREKRNNGEWKAR